MFFKDSKCVLILNSSVFIFYNINTLLFKKGEVGNIFKEVYLIKNTIQIVLIKLTVILVM